MSRTCGCRRRRRSPGSAGARICSPRLGWYLPDTVFLAVVAPGVSGERDAVVLHVDAQWFVGPDAVCSRSWRRGPGPSALHGVPRCSPALSMVATCWPRWQPGSASSRCLPTS
ncbi:SAM-dependent chlorinase/fluorinase [Burkholderia sp. BCC1985]|uniref:SAM-dependent chlorinase/fluorinase n=1 Tax=Burkholderia sp. BCC1985 TaxID=2817442 RepID=UPI002AAF2234|nr:SAM-dependent chlorinase/fluorinase [Burkholderia sp. BCC1985]